MRPLLPAALLAFSLAACSPARVPTAPGASATASLTGTVTYLPRIALAPDAVVRVRLEDVSRADAPAAVLAEQTIPTEGRQVPIPFALRYDPARVEARHRYAVRAEIRDGDGRLRWTSDTLHPVLTGGAPAGQVEIRVVQVEPPPAGERPGDPLAGTSWRLVLMEGAAVPAGGAAYTLAFMDSSRVGGQADCNHFFGQYTLRANGGLQLTQMGSTLAACAPPSLGDAFVGALAEAESFRRDGDGLRLDTRRGLLVFRRADADDETEGSMAPQQTGKTVVFTCPAGGQSFDFTIRTGPGELAVWLPARFGGRYVVLGQTRAASGARYEGDGVVVWNKGSEALLEVEGQSFAGCLENPAETPWAEARRLGVTFRAVGQEPGWTLDIRDGDRIHFVYAYGEHEVTMPAPAPRVADGQTVYDARTPAHALTVTITDEACRDAMSGQPFPATVTVQLDGEAYQGCGRRLAP